jgi:hypothetical protein
LSVPLRMLFAAAPSPASCGVGRARIVVEVRRRARMVFEREGIVVMLLEEIEEVWRKK